MEPLSDAPSAQVSPYLTAHLPGCGGQIKTVPEDFVVEELPRYEPSGTGEHLYVYLEKRGLSTAAVVEHLRRVLGLSHRQIGYAGRKDSRAITRQWLSLHMRDDPPAALLETEAIRVERMSRHGNKLRPGHLLGNRFRIVVRDAAPPAHFPALLERLEREGFPNYFGTQRLGEGNRNALHGRSLLRGDAPLRGTAERLRFVTNAYQAALFNELVALRLTHTGELASVLAGDLVVLHHNGAYFSALAEELPEVQLRADRHELSPSAPLFGHQAPLAAGIAGEWEQRLLQREGLTTQSFRLASHKFSPKGERRPVRAFVQELRWQTCERDGAAALEFAFLLGPGVYATTFLREVMKNDALRGLPDP